MTQAHVPEAEPRKPDRPDGVPEDGHDGSALESAPIRRWQRSTEEQVAWTERALERIRHAMGVWSARAEACYTPGQRSEADDVLDGLWKRRELRRNGLRYLRSYLLPGAAGEQGRDERAGQQGLGEGHMTDDTVGREQTGAARG
jgi:hypothetical protein